VLFVTLYDVRFQYSTQQGRKVMQAAVFLAENSPCCSVSRYCSS
jgi:hypothetical protein